MNHSPIRYPLTHIYCLCSNVPHWTESYHFSSSCADKQNIFFRQNFLL